MSETELIQMLGKPYEKFYDTHINYWLGAEHESYMRIDSDWFSIWVKNDKVFETKIRTD